jgi:hypothetical protein
MPAVTFDVRLAIVSYEPGVSAEASYPKVTVPPGVGGVVLTRNSEPFAGAEAMFTPLDPVRFSAPQFTPESGSPTPAFPRPGPSPGNVGFGPYE